MLGHDVAHSRSLCIIPEADPRLRQQADSSSSSMCDLEVPPKMRVSFLSLLLQRA